MRLHLQAIVQGGDLPNKLKGNRMGTPHREAITPFKIPKSSDVLEKCFNVHVTSWLNSRAGLCGRQRPERQTQHSVDRRSCSTGAGLCMLPHASHNLGDNNA